MQVLFSQLLCFGCSLFFCFERSIVDWVWSFKKVFFLKWQTLLLLLKDRRKRNHYLNGVCVCDEFANSLLHRDTRRQHSICFKKILDLFFYLVFFLPLKKNYKSNLFKLKRCRKCFCILKLGVSFLQVQINRILNDFQLKFLTKEHWYSRKCSEAALQGNKLKKKEYIFSMEYF